MLGKKNQNILGPIASHSETHSCMIGVFNQFYLSAYNWIPNFIWQVWCGDRMYLCICFMRPALCGTPSVFNERNVIRKGHAMPEILFFKLIMSILFFICPNRIRFYCSDVMCAGCGNVNTADGDWYNRDDVYSSLVRIYSDYDYLTGFILCVDTFQNMCLSLKIMCGLNNLITSNHNWLIKTKLKKLFSGMFKHFLQRQHSYCCCFIYFLIFIIPEAKLFTIVYNC